MKKNVILLFSILAMLFACEADDVDVSKNIVITVASELDYYTLSGSDTLFEGLRIKTDEDEDWSVIALNAIDGFDYESGYEYRLSVLETTLANPPQDGSSITYKLIELIEKYEKTIPIVLQPYGGELSQLGYSSNSKQYIGAGYDIMNRYCGFFATKEPIIDLSKLDDGAYVIHNATSSYSEDFAGLNAVEFLTDIERKTRAREVVPEENSGDLLFTGSITSGYNWDIQHQDDPYWFSSQFSFVQFNQNMVSRRHLLWKTHDFDDRLFTDKLKKDLVELSPERIIERYGTHIIKEAFVGSSIRSRHRAVTTSGDQFTIRINAGYYLAKMNGGTHEATESQRDAIVQNYATTTAVEFMGGNTALMPRVAIMNNVIVESWNQEELAEWRASLSDTNETLLKIDADGLIPLYSVVRDETLKAKLKEATIKYIKSKQPTILATTPLARYKEIGRDRYHFNTDRTDCTLVGVLASLYLTHVEGTSPLYLYQSEDSERLSFDDKLDTTMKNMGVIGYCYERQSPHFDEGLTGMVEDLDVLIEITNRTKTKFKYLLNGMSINNEGWEETGIKIYTKKMVNL